MRRLIVTFDSSMTDQQIADATNAYRAQRDTERTADGEGQPVVRAEATG